MANTLRVAMGQILVEQGKLHSNLARAEKAIGEAARQGAQLIVLPECLDLGWLAASVKKCAAPVPGGEAFHHLAEAARRNHIHVCAGVNERDGDRFHNTAVLISPSGELLLKHRKINELRFGPQWDVYATGECLNVADTSLGRIGMNICADNWPSVIHLGHALGHMGACLIVSPCAWAVPPQFDNTATPYGHEWEEAYTQLSRKWNLAVIAVSNVGLLTDGPWTGWRCIGNSLAFAPGGQRIAKLSHGELAEELHIVDLQLPAPVDHGPRIATR